MASHSRVMPPLSQDAVDRVAAGFGWDAAHRERFDGSRLAPRRPGAALPNRIESTTGELTEHLGLAALGRAARLGLDHVLARIALLEAQIADADAAAAELLARTGQHPTTVPGVGPVLAATILGEIGDVRRLLRPQAPVAYAGLEPGVFASGQFRARACASPGAARPTCAARSAWPPTAPYRRDPELGACLRRKVAEGTPYEPR